jgi:23S rRNA (cytosine1962-C5)-methyltransferase
MKRTIPEHWTVAFQDLSVIARLAPYKHTGIFPEQEQNWRWMRDEARNAKVSLKILNLFAYTGGATVALAKDGHFVTHVDAARPSIGWAKENAALNNIGADRIRWMLEDAPAFAAKELKRGKRYDAILLDPPAYGHGPTGKTWRVERDLAPLLEICAKLLSDSPVFLVLNGYAQNAMPESFRRLLSGILFATVKRPFTVETEPLVLRTAGARTLETGIVARVRFRNKK